MGKKEGVKRLQFDFGGESIKRLDELAVNTESVSRAEVVRKALKFYEYTVEMVHCGYKIEFVKGKDKQTIASLIVI